MVHIRMLSYITNNLWIKMDIFIRWRVRKSKRRVLNMKSYLALFKYIKKIAKGVL